MRIINKTAENISNGILTIGYVGENEHTQVVIDCASVFEQYPGAVPAMTIQPPSGDAYPALITRNGNNIIWDILDTDTASNGSGEIQLTFTENNVVVKSCIGMIKVNRSIVPSGDMPTPIEDWLVEANTALNAIPQTIDDALEEAKESGEFDGKDGYTPVKGVDYFDGAPGAKGDKGDPGYTPIKGVDYFDGYTPVKGVDYFDGAPGAKGDKGDPGDPTELIDDTTTASNKAWSSQKTANEINAKYAKPSGGIPASDLSSAVQTSLSSADSAYQKPSGGIPASDLASGVIPSVPVNDVQANGSSIVSNGVANFPMPDEDNFGVVKVMRDTGYYGIGRTSTGYLTTSPATDYQIKDGTDSWKPINPVNQHRAVFYGLAKAAGDSTQSQSSNPVGTYTSDAQSAIKEMLGVNVEDVQLNGTSIVNNGVANIPVADVDTLGTVKVRKAGGYYGITMVGSGILTTSPATDNQVKGGTEAWKPLNPMRQHLAVFFGLSKVAGVDLANAGVTLGEYPDSAKIAIQKMLGIYEAPWELIRMDTGTNATEADVEITVDGNGESFELTDAIVYFTTPQQSTVSGKGDYGRIRFWYGLYSSEFKDAYANQYTQNAEAEQTTSIATIMQKNNMLEILSQNRGGRSNVANQLIMAGHVPDSSTNSAPFQLITPPISFYKISITKVTGTYKYWIYGKRKWT